MRQNGNVPHLGPPGGLKGGGSVGDSSYDWGVTPPEDLHVKLRVIDKASDALSRATFVPRFSSKKLVERCTHILLAY